MSVIILSAFQITLVIILIIFVLLQPPRGSTLSGFSNSSHGGRNSILKVRSSINQLSGATAIVVGLFIINTLLLSGLSSKDVHKKSIAEKFLLEKEQEDGFTSVPFEN